MSDPEPIWLTPDQAAKVINRGRTAVFALLKNGELESVKLGHRTRRITRESCIAWRDRQLANNHTP